MIITHTQAFIINAVAKAKGEILEDIRTGVVPSSVSSFAELGDYTDHNCYGGLCDLEDSALINLCPLSAHNPPDYEVEAGYGMDTFISICNAIQNELDSWIKAGMSPA